MTNPEPPSPKPKFENPYRHYAEEDLTRLQTFVSKKHHEHIFLNLHPGSGSVSTVVNTLFTKLINSLEKYGITETGLQRLDFERFIANCTIELSPEYRLPRSTTKRSPKKGHDGPSRAKEVRSGDETNAGEPTKL